MEGTNEVALWAHQPYIFPFSKIPHSVTGAQSLCFFIYSQPRDPGPAIYTFTILEPSSKLGPSGAFFSCHIQVRMLMFKCYQIIVICYLSLDIFHVKYSFFMCSGTCSTSDIAPLGICSTLACNYSLLKSIASPSPTL
jgi:hypothetical protein